MAKGICASSPSLPWMLTVTVNVGVAPSPAAPASMVVEADGTVTKLNEPGPDLTPMDVDELVTLAAGTPFHDEPGNTHQYSNANHHLLGAIAEKAAGKSL